MTSRLPLVFGMACIAACSGGSETVDGAVGTPADLDARTSTVVDAGTQAPVDTGLVPADAGAVDLGKPASDGGVSVPAVDASIATTVTLPASTFVYVRQVGTAKTIVAYDTLTKQQALLSGLDGNTSGSVRLDVSPDRARVAFTAAFRQTVADAINPSEILWTVTADGKTYERQSPILPDPDSKPCSTNAECDTHSERCNLSKGKCSKVSYRTELLDPEWSADGKTLYLSYGATWTASSGAQLLIQGGVSLASVPVGTAGAGFTPLSLMATACQIVGEPVVHPAGNALATMADVCTSSGAEGIHFYKLPSIGPMGTLTSANEITIASGKGAFVGSTGFAFLGHEAGAQSSVILADLSTGEYATWFEAPSDSSVESITLSPDMRKAVACVRTSSSTDLWLLSLDDSTPVALTSDGASCYPAW